MDKNMESLVSKFCRSAHQEEHETLDEKKETLQKELKPIHEYHFKQILKKFGSKQMQDFYTAAFEDAKSGKSNWGNYREELLSNVELCQK